MRKGCGVVRDGIKRKLFRRDLVSSGGSAANTRKRHRIFPKKKRAGGTIMQRLPVSKRIVLDARPIIIRTREGVTRRRSFFPG